MKKVTALMAGAALVATAGVAGAATHEINMYGASAQYLFWAAAAPTKLTSVDGCTLSKYGKDSGNKYLDIVATNCTAPPSPMAVGDDIIFRYASKASYSGIWALKGKADPDDKNPNSSWTSPVTPAGDLTQTCQHANNGSLGGGYRWFGDESTFTGGTPAAPATITGGVCKPVHIAASDVEGETFTQSSVGKSKGPMGGTAASIVRSFTGANAVDASGLANAKPLVVPFGLFVNRAVSQYKCYGDTNTPSTNGNLCYRDADCGAGHCAATSDGLPMYIASNCTNANTIDQLTREKVVAIYSGAVLNWADFGGHWINTPIVACLRHAGSGTHSTLDWTVMFKNWGASLVISQKLPLANHDYPEPAVNTVYNPNLGLTPESYPRTYLSGNIVTPDGNIPNNNVIWFNDGSSDMVNCVKGANAASTWTGATAHSASCIGAVGYADADQAASLPGNVVAIAYAGHIPNRSLIRNCNYDFFSNQNMYWWASDLIANAFAGNLDSFASNAANLTSATVGNKADYWNARGEMFCNRSALKNYPVRVIPTANNNQP